MLNSLRDVSEQTFQFACSGQCTLENVTNIVEAYTKIDKILFVRYEAEEDNPIWGEFFRWQQFEPYKGEQTIVEVKYASHLSLPWMRFVVCKELAHSLESVTGTHTVTDGEVSSLVTELSLISTSKNEGLSPAGSVEKLAEAAALEILLPLKLRQKLISDNGGVSDEFIMDVANRHQIPLRYAYYGFNEGYNNIIADMLK